MIEKFA